MGSNRPAARNQRAKLAADLNDLFKDLQSSQVKVVGNYHLGQAIGQGTYGKVKQAMHTLTGQQVAIKIVSKTHAAIITREIYHWRCLSHPNIAHLHEVLTTESKIYLVTEYCPNGELLEALIRDGRCRPALAKRWFRQICLAVQYCHLRKIVHRDLKLENILLDSQNNIKLIDFGFTRECESKKLLESYCGSAAYTAPEIIVGKKYSGPEADIWSLGVILYTLLAGYLPFDDDNEAVVQDKIVDLDYEMPTDLFCKDAQDLIQSILKEDPKDRFSIEQILNHAWWTPLSDDDEEGAENESQSVADPDFYAGGPHHARQGSLTKREIHPVQSTQRPGDVFYGSGSPQLASPLAQHPYGPWGAQSPYTFSPVGDSLKASLAGGPAVPSPLSSPLPSPSPMVNKAFPRYETSADGSQIGRTASAGSFPSNAFEQRLLLALGKIGFDQEIFAKGIPAQSCDPAYGLWCLLVDQVRQRALDNGTTVEWEQSIALMDAVSLSGMVNPNTALSMMENGKRSPRPMSDPSPSSSQTNLLLPQLSAQQQQHQQQQHTDLQQQTIDLKLQLDHFKLETELLKIETHQLKRLAEAAGSKVHPFDSKELPPISAQNTSGAEKPVQDSGVSVSTSSTPHSSWELAERESPVTPTERTRRKSKGILHSIKDRFFSASTMDMDSNHSGSPSPHPPLPHTPSPHPPKRLAGSTASASSSASSATTFVTSSTPKPKPLPAPPAHPYPHLLQHHAAHSPLSAVSYKSASTSSLVMETGHASTSTAAGETAMSDHLVSVDHSLDHDPASAASHKNRGFMTWITESASGTVLNKSPVVQSAAKVPKRLNNRSFSTADTIPLPATETMSSTSSLEDARPQIPAIPASFFQSTWKAPSGHKSSSSQPNAGSSAGSLATSAPTMSFRQRLASFSSTSAKITPEERQRATAAAAAAAAIVGQPALPERAHSPSPPSSPRGSGGSSSFANLSSTKNDHHHQSEISDIVAAAVAATASANLKSSGSRKKNQGLERSGPKKSKSSEKSVKSSTASTSQNLDSRTLENELNVRQMLSSYKQQSAPSLQIPSPLSTGVQAKEALGSKDAARKSSIKSSKASMPSLMTAFSSFKPSKSAPSSPLTQQPIHPPMQNPLSEATTRIGETKIPKENKGSRHDEPSNLERVTSISSARSSAAMNPNSTARESFSRSRVTDVPSEVVLKDDIRAGEPLIGRSPTTRVFGDGVVIQDEVRPKKRTTSRTSITAASIGRKSSESVASSLERTDPPSPQAPISSSKRASLGSIGSRRSSSSSSMRDRNIFGLTLDSTGSGSRKSSLNLSRATLSKSTFASPSTSPAQPRRGGEMDRERTAYGFVSRASHDEGHASPRTSASIGIEDRSRDSLLISTTTEELQEMVQLEQGQRSRPESTQEVKETGRREKSLMHPPSPTMQPRGIQSAVADTNSPASESHPATISPSLSQTSSLNRVAIAGQTDMQGQGPLATDGTGANAIPINRGEEDRSFTLDAPRVDFADGCSLIPSPPPSPATLRQDSLRNSGSASTVSDSTGRLADKSHGMLEEPKVNLLSTSYPPPRTSFSYTRAANEASESHQGSLSPPSPSRPLVSFDQHFSNQAKIKEHRDSTPRKVVTGFQPLAAKRLSKPGLPNSSSNGAGAGDVPALPGLPGQSSSLVSAAAGSVSTHPSNTSSSSFSSTMGPPNAFAGRRRGYRNSTGSMANMTLQQQQNFQHLQREQLLKIQQNQPNAGYEATAAMKINPRPRTGFYPKREYGGAGLGGLGGLGSANGPSSLGSHSGLTGPGGVDHSYDTAAGGSKRDSYSSRRQSMAVAMGKRPGASPAAIQEEEE